MGRQKSEDEERGRRGGEKRERSGRKKWLVCKCQSVAIGDRVSKMSRHWGETPLSVGEPCWPAQSWLDCFCLGVPSSLSQLDFAGSALLSAGSDLLSVGSTLFSPSLSSDNIGRLIFLVLPLCPLPRLGG